MSPALGTNPLKETLFKRTTGKAGEQPAPQEALRPPDDEAPAPETPLQPPPESIQAVAFNIGGNRFGGFGARWRLFGRFGPGSALQGNGRSGCKCAGGLASIFR